MNEISRRQFLEAAAGTAAVPSLAERQKAEPAVRASAKVTLTCADYLRFTPLATGDLRPKDFALHWIRGPRSDMLSRALTDPAVDGGEGSMLAHLLRIEAGDRSMVAVPAFPLRNFTARDIYVRKGSSLKPADLNGRRIGIYNWAASGAVWYRHLLRYFKQDPAAIQWVVGGADQPAGVPARAQLPAHVRNAPPNKSLSDLLLAGALDAIFAPLPPKLYHPLNGPIVRLIPDFPAVERRYFLETRCYPPQHAILIKEKAWQRDPAIGRKLLETLSQCETMFQAGQRMFPYGSPWLMAELEEAELLMGRDFHAHGLEKNRIALEVFCRSAFEDGLTRRQVTVEEYFGEFLKG
jgi:4,5-dihydroxyphthalate decarboxylase